MTRKNKQNNKSKKAQVAIFIIIALIIVIAIVLIFVLWRTPGVEVASATDPESFIEECVKEYAKEAISILAKQGGDIEPEGSVMYKSENITYLCYNANFYKPCINQRPMLIEHIESGITDYTRPKILACFSNLKKLLGEKGYEVNYGDMELKTELQTKRVSVTIGRTMEMVKGEETRRFEEFKAQVSWPLYDLAEIAMEIANQEARYCNFDVLGFMIIYPKYNIEKFRTGNSDNIYTLKDITTGKEFTFAIRSCAMPAGL